MVRYVRGLVYLALSKAKYLMSPYTPKPVNDVEGCIDYDCQVVELWKRHATQRFSEFALQDKVVVEVGPGADLGIATILLSLGVRKYYAFDVHDLVANVQSEFYENLVERIASEHGLAEEEKEGLIQAAVEYSRTGDGRINYVCKEPIDFSELEDGEVDIVFSQAALEHLGDTRTTLGALSGKCKSGALFVAEVDLKAHSRWVRDHDPLNIYIYDDFIYRLFSHKASSNRVRPREYAAILEDCGWSDVAIVPIKVADTAYLESIRGSIRHRFRDEHLSWLSIMLLARKT